MRASAWLARASEASAASARRRAVPVGALALVAGGGLAGATGSASRTWVGALPACLARSMTNLA